LFFRLLLPFLIFVAALGVLRLQVGELLPSPVVDFLSNADLSCTLSFSFERPERQGEYIEAVLVLILCAVFHHVQFRLAHFVIFEGVHDIVFGGPAMPVLTRLIEKVLKMVDLSDLALDGECRMAWRPRLIVVPHGLLDSPEYLRVYEKADDDQPGSSFSGLAVHRNDRLREKVVLDRLELVLLETVAVVMPGQAVDDILLLLDHPLQEEEHIHADVEEGPGRADVMVHHLVLSVAEFGDLRVLVLSAGLQAEIVNLDHLPVSLPQKSHNVVLFVSDRRFRALGRIAHGDDEVGNVRQIEVVSLHE
jgi:hypothetical protein